MSKGKTFITGIALLVAFECATLPSEAAELTPSMYRFNLTFRGGTPPEFVAAINEAVQKSVRDPRPINVVVPPELSDVRIPPVELRLVDARTIFQSLNMASLSSANALEWVETGEHVWVLMRRADNRETKALYVGNLLQKFKIDDITTALRTTWDLGPTGVARPELKYHKDTQLLIVRAYPAQLKSMVEVVDELRLAIEPSASREAKARDDKKVR